jgi:hypothetical protein
MGTPQPHSWLDLDPKVNTSIGGQARRHPIGYKPTEFVFVEDERPKWLGGSRVIVSKSMAGGHCKPERFPWELSLGPHASCVRRLYPQLELSIWSALHLAGTYLLTGEIKMKRTLALAGVVAFLWTLAPASDHDNKVEKKPDPQPARVILTAAQSKMLQEIDLQFQRLQEEAQKQAQILSARESGLITAFVMGTKLEGKQYKLVKEKDAYAVEEVLPPSPESSSPGAPPKDAQSPGHSNPAGGAQPAPSAPPNKQPE